MAKGKLQAATPGCRQVVQSTDTRIPRASQRIVGGQAYRQAYALSKAMGRRPTPQLAAVFFQALKTMGKEATKIVENRCLQTHRNTLESNHDRD